MRRFVGLVGMLVIFALAGGDPPLAWGQTSDPTKVVVMVKGSRRMGSRLLTKNLEKHLEKTYGVFVPIRVFNRTQTRLQIPKKDRTKPSRLAETAKEIGASYVIFVRLERKGGKIRAKSYLVEAEDGAVVHKYFASMKRPRNQASALGKAIGTEMTARIAELHPTPPIAAAPEAPSVESPEEPVVETPEEPAADTVAVAPSLPEAPPEASDTSAPAVSSPVVPADTVPDTPAATEPLAAAPAPNPGLVIDDPSPAPAGPPTTETTVPSGPLRTTRDIELRAQAGIGAGLIRDYRVGADQLDVSDLSHSLSPIGMGALRLEIILREVFVGIEGGAAFRPVGYTVVADGQTSEPGGSLIDLDFAVNGRIPLGETEGGPTELLPRIGTRISLSNVDDHPGNIIPSSTALTLVLGLGARIPYDERLEINVGADAGLVASYSESGGRTGQSGGGFAFGANLAILYWMSDLIGLGINNRFQTDLLSFDGTPTRGVTIDELDRLTDASVTITDFRAALSLHIRI